MKAAIKITICLNLVVFMLIYTFAIPLGILSASFPHSVGDRISTVTLFILYSLPSFFVAEVLRGHLSDQQGMIWFPIMGLHSNNADSLAGVDWFMDLAHHAVLPILCMTYGGLAYISRQMRAGMMEVIRQDYIRTARAKGAGEVRIMTHHVLRNALIPILTRVVLAIPFLFMGSLLLEAFFGIPGLGSMMFDAIQANDFSTMRIRSNKNELLIFPEKEYTLYVVQSAAAA